MLNSNVSKFILSLMVFCLVASLSACGHFGGSDDGEKAMEQMEQSEESAEEAMAEGEEKMKSHADQCPHGGGACCAHEEPHPCCSHTQPDSQPAE